MKYTRITQGRFLERPNRFIALVEIDGQIEKCHVKNTGRCRELLVPGALVWLEKSDNPNRKTQYDLVAVRKQFPRKEDCFAGSCSPAMINIDSQSADSAVGSPSIMINTDSQSTNLAMGSPSIMINMDSQAPNQAVREWLEQNKSPFPEITILKPECTYGSSRIDFYVETAGQQPRKIFIEVKGVTLEEDGIARFPDAPTERGIKHMLELQKAIQEGYESYILFVIQMKGIRWFEPNDLTHPAFGETLRQVHKAGVNILAYDCKVTPEEITLDMPVKVKL